MMKVIDTITCTSHYERFTTGGAGFILNGCTARGRRPPVPKPAKGLDVDPAIVRVSSDDQTGATTKPADPVPEVKLPPIKRATA